MTTITILLSYSLIFLSVIIFAVGFVGYLTWSKLHRNHNNKTNFLAWFTYLYLPILIFIAGYQFYIYSDIRLVAYLQYLYFPYLLFLNLFPSSSFIPPITLFIAITCFWMILINFLVKLITGKIFKKISLNQIHPTDLAISSLIGTTVSILVFIGLVIFLEPRDNVPAEFHIFNAHLKDVCSIEKYQTECPRTQADLRQFDQQHFDQLNQKALVRYYFDEHGKGTLITRSGNNFYVSDSRFDGRFQIFYRQKFDSTTLLYPPDFEGEWHLGYIFGLL